MSIQHAIYTRNVLNESPISQYNQTKPYFSLIVGTLGYFYQKLDHDEK